MRKEFHLQLLSLLAWPASRRLGTEGGGHGGKLKPAWARGLVVGHDLEFRWQLAIQVLFST